MILSIIYFILILGTIVLVHEFGHFFFAKLFGVYVYEFSIGMGPKLLSKKGKNGETTYCLRAIPIGGFVQLAGEGLDDDKEIPKKRLLQSKPVWQRFLIMFFGAGNNFILAIVTLFFLALFVGSPSNSNLIPSVIPNSPAEIAGIKGGDYIIEVNGKKVNSLDDLQLYLTIETTNINEQREKDKKENVEKKYDFEVKILRSSREVAIKEGIYKLLAIKEIDGKRYGLISIDSEYFWGLLDVNNNILNGSEAITATKDDIDDNIDLTTVVNSDLTINVKSEEKTLRIEPLDVDEATKREYTIGISFDNTRKYGFLNAIKYAFKKTGSLIRQMVITIKELVTGNVSVKNLSGPVGILRAVDQTQKESTSKIIDLLSLLALLSLNVGFINLIPFPAFDGGRILFLLIEKIIRRPIKPEVENMVNNIGFVLLILLIIYVTFGDIRNWIGF